MRTKSPLRTETLHAWTIPIRYRWSTPDGTVHHCQTSILSPTRRGIRAAIKRFFLTHTHVDPEVS